MEDSNASEASRSEMQARLAAIIESSDDAIVSKTLDGIITTWNRGAERIFGWTAEEAVGRPITLIIPPDRLQEEPVILQRIRSGERVDHFETIRQTKDGRLLHVSVTISPVRNHEGRVVGVSKVARDITLQKELYRELQAARDVAQRARAVAEEARETAERASRARDRFLSVLSHELRTPLTPALAGLALIREDARMPPEFAEHLDTIRRNVETEARLVDDLLDLTRISHGRIKLHFELVDAHAVIRDVISMCEPEIASKGLKVATTLRAGRHYVWADPGRFQQMLLNLLSNAVKFTSADGVVTVRTEDEEDFLRIEVIDTGIGIDPDVLPRLFQPFEQGERTITRQFGGLGLGLSLVKMLADLHGAIVTASSGGRNRGAAFVLRMKAAAAEPSPLAPAREPAASGRICRVLLVEDHRDTRLVMARLLSSFGCTVTTAGTVREAVEAVERNPFDILISDIGLPDGSGIEVMKHVAARANIPGIALSGFGQDEDVRTSEEAGFAAHLIKPVNLQALRDAIQKIAG